MPRRSAMLMLAAVLGMTLPGRAGPPAAPPPPDPPAAGDGEPDVAARPRLAEADESERLTLQRMLASGSWARRAIAAARLERYGCEDSRALLTGLLDDRAWQVRAYSVRSLGRRREVAGESWFAAEQEPRVLRAALRHHYRIEIDRLGRGVRFLARSSRLDDKLLAAELGAASGDEQLVDVARDAARRVILRMSRSEGGMLSPRLARITDQRDLRRTHRWQTWLMKTGRGFTVVPGHSVPPPPRPVAPSLIARLEPERFAALEDYIEKLSARELDLAICLDCTASMSGELAAAQAGIDDLMLFVGDVVGSLRVALVAYRDRRDREFETTGWDFTSGIDEARRRLWQLSADGGGDRREAVYPAMKLAYTRFTWMPDHAKVLVLVGDAPPHVGYGTKCIDMARRAAVEGLVTHVIQCEGEDVEHFPEIAEAGEGRCVALEDDDTLVVEIAGLTLGDVFMDELREFFTMYQDLCR